MSILAVYDVAGIQDYIFTSNKLSENVGGSRLVADVFRRMLPEAILSECNGDCKIDWECGGALTSPPLGAEIIYQGGGNAYVAYRENTIFQAVTKAFLLKVTEQTRGLGIAVAAIETELNSGYKDDFRRLNERLAIVKSGLNRPAFMGNQPITKQSTRTGMPVSEFFEYDYIDAAQKRKRRAKQIHEDVYPKGVDLFADLVIDTKGADSFIGVVHADGNSMGVAIGEYMKEFDTYDKAVPAMRTLSKRIADCYCAALDKASASFSGTPILRLITDGDDITVILKGRFAIPFAAKLLQEIEATPKAQRPFENKVPTACAGVVLFHAHYPFSNAYALAEECCGKAKKLSRTDPPHSFIDFHLHQGGNVADLDTLRDRQYTVNDKSIICRPWSITKGIQPEFDWLDKHISQKAKLDNWPSNKSKELRNAIAYGDHEADLAAEQARSQGLGLPMLDGWKPSEKQSKYAPYFDLLEIVDVYEKEMKADELQAQI